VPPDITRYPRALLARNYRSQEQMSGHRGPSELCQGHHNTLTAGRSIFPRCNASIARPLASDDARQHARERRALALGLVLPLPPRRGACGRSLVGCHPGAVLRPAHGLHPMWDRRGGCAAELDRAAGAAELDREAMAMSCRTRSWDRVCSGFLICSFCRLGLTPSGWFWIEEWPDLLCWPPGRQVAPVTLF